MKIARTYYLASALCLALLSATGATAATIQLRASLNGAQEVPPNLVTPASGTGVMTFDTVTRQLTWTISYSGLQSAIGDAHFHGPTPAGFDAGIQVPIGPGASPLVGAATLTVQQAADLLAGQYYINIHSVNLPGGEIRGQVLPVRGDFNADGQADIFWRNTDGTNYVWNVNGSSISGGVLAIASQGLLPGVDNTWAVAGVGDFNGDGKLDIFWRRNDGTNYIWHVDGATINGGVLSIVSQGLLPTVDTSWTVVGIGDFNGDGKSDVLWRRNDGTNYVWHVDGTTINGGVLAISSQGLLPTVDTSWNVAGVGDFNGDGKGDILWRRSDGTNYVWHVNGASISGGVLAIATQGLLPGVPTTWSVVGVGDFSGEGLSDILWRNADGTNYVWHVNGSIITGGVLSILSQGLLPGVTDLGWGVVGVADYNGDGKADIFWRHTDGTNYVWHVDGATINGGVLVISTQGLLPAVGATGWSVVSTPRQTNPAGTWLSGEGLRGFDGDVRATILWDRDGPGGQPPVLVAAGDFNIAGTTFANNIAIWNGISWEPLGSGTSGGDLGRVFALAVLPNGDLVAGGSFRTAGGVTVDNIARWNGSTWSALGTGMVGLQSTVNSLAVLPNGDLVAGGYFTTADGVTVNNIARWNGSAWSAFGTGVGGTIPTVRALAVYPNGTLVAAGTFSSAGGIAATNIAYWNGSTWSALGTGLNGAVNVLAVLPNGDLVAGGGGIGIGIVFRWNGITWTDMSAGFFGATASVMSFAILNNGTLVAGGVYSGINASIKFIGFWNGTAWEFFDNSVNNTVYTLTVLPNGDLVAGGSFIKAGDVTASRIARWNGSSWGFYGTGFGGISTGSILNEVIYAFARLPNGDIVAGGTFKSAGSVEASNIAQWNGSSWFTLGAGMNGSVFSVASLPNGDIIAGGGFTTAGGVVANRIARWNGSTWSPLGTGINGTVTALTVLPNGDLVAGGSFGTAGGVVANRIARWDGSTWSPLGTGITGTGTVTALAAFPNGDLVAGGSFVTAGGVTVNNIARWNGSTWSSVGSGVNGAVNALAVLSNGDLVAGGRFGTAGGPGSHRLARWNGSTWSGFGTGISLNGTNYINTITELANGDLVVGGHFPGIGFTDTLNVALWNGSTWSALGSGTSGAILSDVYSLFALPDGGFVMGGAFPAVNGQISAIFARWMR